MTWTAAALTAAQLNLYLPQDWSAYTPTLTASTTSPTMGGGAVTTGRYLAFNKLIIVEYRIVFGTAMAAGSGTYRISLPVAPSTLWSNRFIGNGHCIDASVPGIQPVILRVNGTAQSMTMTFPATYPGGALADVNHNNLYPWATSDEFQGLAIYEAA